ncbi:serine/threonine-protein kinase [Streptomyces sp. 35G-GA-8]|uniref:serine/threonine-protein kinase n=1 Tax=Streptomyces sp. 35G-GA-8 TaxID=2939434 RepID=UPI00201F13DE|nr:serine/threonine-protein kinase [Streptomyces sp. 35G-GA-8]MCL7376427.1 serine/threonine protein kinase [Streptomyces sp. 35G-GA-8]
MQPLEAGDPATIGPYRLLGRLGSGGMGRVYVARSQGGRTVAVKVVHPHFAMDQEFRARFRREVEAARRVGTGPDGPRWSAPVLDADPEAVVPWVATAYVAGPSLTQAVGAYGPLPEHSVRALGAGLAEALAAVHGLDLVHRDVKPSNVLLAPDGPRLIDFGIARATDGTASLTSTGVSVGSPGYMSPEQILGKVVTGAADVFSLGAVLAYAVTGTSPFPGDSSAALLYKVVHEEPELGSLRGELRELVADCLAKDPSARPAPTEIVRRLVTHGAGGTDGADRVDAAHGAAGLMAAGWLPAPLVEEVSRAVVRLLHLEAADPPVQTGPVPFSSPALGVFGPPTDPPMDVPMDVPVDVSAGPRLSVSVSADTGTGAGPGTGPDTDTGLGTGPGGGRRARKVSCTVALAVAGALAAVMVGSAFLFDLMPGGGTNDTASPGKADPPSSVAASTPATGEAPGDGDGSGDGSGDGDDSVPAELVGIWDGEVTASGLPAGTMKVTIQTGATGERIGKAEQTDILGNFICEDLLTLTGVEGKTLVVDAKRGPRSKDMCTETTTGLRLGLERDGLRYLSRDARAGSPTGILTKQR